ncbi:uncharacterized protein LOC117209818 [Bombus bifarius]|uniref:Uncharacterized protein LOC117209818 n=1 Tax=Bombus bifarius TaxID=103933 RepID=A0A6P8M3N2_9HYME|nr:uncharacterized protein LOC117166187 [Bombus vancouverensis nearcticus]XP_033308116.1 uncharacterized protein LOC117209818 [Bombus bifarius]
MTTIARLLAGIVILGFITRTEGRCSHNSWEKIAGVKPETIDAQTVLFSAVNSNGITKSCFERCKRVNCTAFVIDFGRSVCYSVRIEDDELVPEPNSIFYHRVCVKVPVSCARRKLWQVERSPGAVFIDSSAFHLSDPITRNQCYEKCIETGRSCESAQFRTSKPLSIDKTAFGRCSLSLYERGTRPRAYRASMYRDEYLRDQCRNLSRDEYCSYAEFQNVSLPYSDVALMDLDEKQCEKRCDSSVDGFICRGYTFANSSGQPLCLLHSEDTTSLGVSSLIDATNVVYREREPCLDLKVRCNDSTMTVELKTSDPFFGRLYSNGYADTCDAQGTGSNRTILTLPIPPVDQIREGTLRCGLHPAFSVDDQNRTRPLVWATIVVQFNPIVQRLGDQAVRVGCSLNDRAPPQPKNVTVQSSFSFLDPNAGVPPISSTIVNASSQAPIVTMRILDENSAVAMVTHLGQKLTLKIQLSPPDGPYDITAGHLVASSASGDASYLLLDELGCPTDPTTFPALSKDPVDGRSLIATFTAFKFPNSQRVRFNVLVRFCLDKCIPTNCNGDKPSYGKKKRASESWSTQATYHAETTPTSKDETPDELSLELSIIVQNSVASSADRLSSRENSSPDTVLIAGGNSVDGLLCVDASLALSLLIFLLIVQITLIVGCLLTVAQYRRTAIRAEEDRANILARHLYGIHGGNLDVARRVRWADHNLSSLSRD